MAADSDAMAAESDARTSSADPLLPSEVYRIVDGHEQRDGLWDRVQLGMRSLVTSPPAREEVRIDHELRQLRTRGLQRNVTVALGSIKGGVGKTTLALALADTLTDCLRCGVLVVDADLEWGTAADCTPPGAVAGGTLVDLLARRHSIESVADLDAFLVTLPGGARLLAGPTEPEQIERLRTEDMQALLDLLHRFFPVILLDLSPGIGLRGTIPRWAFATADEIVAVATPTRASLRRAGRMLAYLAHQRPEVPLTLVLNMVPRRPDEAVRRIVEVAEQDGAKRRYAAVPGDDLLMRQLDMGLLELEALDQSTRIAIKNLTLGLASGWCE
jgi:MinD-like ATPase involved in chromosome partitioning or flagellar assembly